jgi:hypothetical protein
VAEVGAADPVLRLNVPAVGTDRQVLGEPVGLAGVEFAVEVCGD